MKKFSVMSKITTKIKSNIRAKIKAKKIKRYGFIDDDLEYKDNLWDDFVNDVCERDLDSLTIIQRNAVVCYFYVDEMNSGGHASYFDNYSEEVKSEYLESAILEIGTDAILANYKNALINGEKDEYEKTDDKYFSFEPSLEELLINYVLINRDEIFSVGGFDNNE